MAKKAMAERPGKSKHKKHVHTPKQLLILLAQQLPLSLAQARLTSVQVEILIRLLSEILSVIDGEIVCPLGCCTYTANHTSYKRNMCKSTCDSLHGTWSSNLC